MPASELEQDAPLTFGRSLPPAAEVTAEASAELREERPKLLDFPPKLVAEQLTRMDAVSSGALGLGGARLGGPSAAPDLLFPQPQSNDVGASHSSPTYPPGDLGHLLAPKSLLSPHGQ